MQIEKWTIITHSPLTRKSIEIGHLARKTKEGFYCTIECVTEANPKCHFFNLPI